MMKASSAMKVTTKQIRPVTKSTFATASQLYHGCIAASKVGVEAGSLQTCHLTRSERAPLMKRQRVPGTCKRKNCSQVTYDTGPFERETTLFRLHPEPNLVMDRLRH
jgi:hypothetical protein